MKSIRIITMLLGIFTIPQSQATSYEIDSNQSYLEVNYLTWIKGDPVSLIDFSTGESTLVGYFWQQTTIAERFGLSGTFDMIASPDQAINNWTPISFDHVALHTDAPDAVSFSLPNYLGLEVNTGEIAKYVRLCPAINGSYTSCFVSWNYEYEISSANGVQTANSVILDGVKITSLNTTFNTAQLSLTQPSDPVLLNSAVTYHVIAQAVPEPETVALFMTGLGLVGFWVRRRRNKIIY